MIVHRLLDAFFRGLDAVDAARDRVDQLLGREPRPDPWAVDWPPADAAPPAPPPADKEPAPAKTTAASSKPTEKPASKPAQAKSTAKDRSEPKKKAGRKKVSSSKRKGSVDRSGKDLSTKRAERVAKHVASAGLRKVDADDEVAGKKVLARVVWALGAAREAGEAEGMTTKDVSALLSSVAGIEVFTTNIGRACRDHADLIEPSSPEGRSKRYRLTDTGAAEGRPLLFG